MRPVPETPSPSNPISRRALLTSAPASVVLATVPTLADAGDPAAAAFAAWVRAMRARDAFAGPDWARSQAELDPFTARIAAAERRLAAAEASTLQGAAVKLLWLWSRFTESWAAEDHILYGAAVDPEDMEDERHGVLRRLVDDLNRMTGVM